MAFKITAINLYFFTKLKFQVQSTHLSPDSGAETQKIHTIACSMQNYFGRCLTLYTSASCSYYGAL